MKTYYDLAKTLKLTNLGTPKEVVVFLDRDDLSLLDQVDKLVNLEHLSLLDGKEFKKIPAAIFKLKNLKSLRIRGAGVSELPEELGDLTSLTKIDIGSTPIQKMPTSLTKLKKLEEFRFLNTSLEVLPDDFGDLRALKKVYLRNCKIKQLPDSICDLPLLKELEIWSPLLEELPSELGNLVNLEILRIRQSQLKKIPATIGELQQLKRLYVEDGSLTELPTSFGKLKKLNLLYLTNNEFEVFPKEIVQCLALETLYLTGNKMTDLPEELAQLKNINRLGLEGNIFENLPDVLLDWWTTFGTRSKYGFSLEKEVYKEAKIFELFNKKAYQKLTRKEKKNYYTVFLNNPENLRKLSPLLLRLAMNAKINSVADNALAFLTQNSLKTIDENSQVLFLGKLAQPKEVLIEQMEACKLKIATKYTEKVTHILVSSRSNKKLDKLPENQSWQWVTEAQIMAYMDTVNPAYLVEAAINTEVAEDSSVEQVANLIMTLNEDNMALAIELITGGGLPEELITEVFIAYKLSEVDATRKKAKKLLEKRASVALKKVLRKRTVIRKSPNQYYYEKHFREMRQKLLDYTTDTPIDLGKLSWAVAMQSGLGKAIALDHAPFKLKCRLLQEKLIKNNVFNLGYYTKFHTFPVELTEMLDLKEITLNVVTGAWENGVYIANKKFKIPKELVRLQNLEKLTINYVLIEDLPLDIIGQLKNLKFFSCWTNKPIDLNPIKKLLPNCNFEIRVRVK